MDWRAHSGAVLPALAGASYFLQDTSGFKWGDGLEFVAVASHLGVAHPPGYPLFTLLGWLALRLPMDPYQAVLLVCKGAVLLAVLCLYALAIAVLAERDVRGPAASWIAGLMSAALAFSPGLWTSTHVIEVYGLSTALTLLAAAMLASGRAGLLVAGAVAGGLALANHLTTLALLPMLVWAIALRWRAGDRAAAATAACLYVSVPLCLYASLAWRVPLDDAAHGIYWGAPSNPAAWLAHVRGGEYGQYQLLAERPGVPFTLGSWLAFAVGRVVTIIGEAGALFCGRGIASVPAGLLLMGLAALGTMKLLASERLRWAVVSLLALVKLQFAFIVLYNIPDFEDYLITPLLLLACAALAGLAAVVDAVLESRVDALELRRGRVLAAVGAALLLAAFATNRASVPPLDAPVAEAWTARLLAALPEGAAVITRVDADVYTLWYIQFARRERLDLLVYGSNFNRFPWARATLTPGDPRRAAVGFTAGPPAPTMARFIDALESDAIAPLLADGRRVFLVAGQTEETDAIGRRFRLVPVATLLTDNDWRRLQAANSINFAPPELLEILPR